MKEKKTWTPAQKYKRKKQIHNIVRRVIQIAFFLLLPSLFSEAFSGVKGIFQQIGKGEVLSLNPFLKTFLCLCLITIFFGRWFCGYACAFGAIGDFFFGISTWLQKKTKKKLPKIPDKWIGRLQNLKYINLLVILFVCTLGMANLINEISPWVAFSRITMLDFKVVSYLGGAICLLVIIIGMMWKERFFCQFLCPLGAIFSLLPIMPWAVLNRSKENCIPNCMACKNQCPVNQKVEGVSLYSNECIQCGKCALTCPKQNIQTPVKGLLGKKEA